ncbi:MAG: 50S ribosomal protein L30 [Candidatus Diapherotrites archaeon]
MIAVIRTRGSIGVPQNVLETMNRLHLRACNQMVLLEDNESIRGMLFHANPYIAYGKIDTSTLTLALEKRGRIAGNKKLGAEFLKAQKLKSVEEIAKQVLEKKKKLKEFEVKPVFRLHPPKKGFERGGIKTAFQAGGVWGDRKEKINELIRKMV